MALVKPGACHPVIDMDSGELYYQVTATDKGSYKQVIYVHYMEMLHFKQPRFGGLEGTDPTKVLTNTLGYDREVRKISLSQLKGSNEGLKVKFASNMDEEAKKADAKFDKEKNTILANKEGQVKVKIHCLLVDGSTQDPEVELTFTVKNIADFYRQNGGLLVEENGVEIERLQRELVDSKLLDTDKVSRSRIAMVYNVPEHFIGNNQSSYSSQEQLNMEFLTYNLVPTVNQYEAELNKKTLSRAEKAKGYRYKFNIASLLRADTQARGQFYQIMRRGGAYSANDVRRFEDLQPINKTGMDDYHISGDLYPIDMDPTLRKTTSSKSVAENG